MDEDIFAILALDEAKTFARVKPLYRACFFHDSSPSRIPAFLPYRLSVMPRSRELREHVQRIQTMREDFKAILSLARLVTVNLDEFRHTMRRRSARELVWLSRRRLNSSAAREPTRQAEACATPGAAHAAPRYGMVIEKYEDLSASFLPSPVGGSPILLPYILINENFR